MQRPCLTRVARHQGVRGVDPDHLGVNYAKSCEGFAGNPAAKTRYSAGFGGKGSGLSGTLGARLAGLRVLLDVIDDHAGDVAAGGTLDALESR